MASGSVDKFFPLKYDEYTGSGNGWGNYGMIDLDSTKYTILSMWITGRNENGYSVVPYKAVGKFGFKVIASGQGGGISTTNGSVTVGYVYIENESIEGYQSA